MGTWIRSQNKKRLAYCKDIEVYKTGKTWEIFDGTKDITLGVYKTENRALEVLDEIQRHVEICCSVVYEMPKNDFIPRI